MSSRRALMLALVSTLLLVGWVASRDEGDGQANAVKLAVRPAAAVPARSATPELSAALGAAWAASPISAIRSAWPAAEGPALRAWSPPPPPPPPAAARVAPPPPAAPQPPPMPYTLIGRFEDGGQVMALISGPTRTLSAKAGDVLDGEWRIDAIQTNAVTLTWLPANVSQTLAYKPS